MVNATRPFPSAAEALSAIQGWDRPSLQRRSTLASAVRLLCRLQGLKPPASVRLDPATCLPAIDGASATALGMKTKTHRNYRAALRYVLRRLGLLAPAHRREAIKDPAWAHLVEALPARFHPHRLRAFMGFCAAKAIAPGDVTGSTLESYLLHHAESRGGPNIRSDVREVARQWNKMRALIAGWPNATLNLLPPEGRVQALPFTTYPVGLQAEIAGYLAWLANGAEDEEGDDDYEPASPETVETRKKGLRLLLWGVVETGRAPDSLTQLSDLVQFDLAVQSLRWHRQRLGKPNPRRPAQVLPTSGTAVLADTVRSMAVYFNLTGEADKKLRRMLAKYRPKAQREIKEDLAKLLDRLAEPDVEAKLLHLPQLLMHKARRLRDGWTNATGVNHPPDAMASSWMAAIAAAIEIELHLPLRIHDLARLRLDEELFLDQANKGALPEVHLRVVASKNERVVETWLHGEAAEPVVEYLRNFRHLGPHAMTDWVFPNRDREDRPRAKNGFAEAIADTVFEHTGVRVNVHAFRAFAAALILEDHPHAIEDIRAMLGHSHFDVALKHYRRSNRQGAAQRVSEGISNRRQRAAAGVPLLGLALDMETRRRSTS